MQNRERTTGVDRGSAGEKETKGIIKRKEEKKTEANDGGSSIEAKEKTVREDRSTSTSMKNLTARKAGSRLN